MQFDKSMSLPVLNFGLKLYNIQNKLELFQLIGDGTKLELDPSISEGDAPSSTMSIWQTKEKFKLQRKGAHHLLDKGYDHTEFELLRKLFGHDDAFYLLYRKVTDETIKRKIE